MKSENTNISTFLENGYEAGQAKKKQTPKTLRPGSVINSKKQQDDMPRAGMNKQRNLLSKKMDNQKGLAKGIKPTVRNR